MSFCARRVQGGSPGGVWGSAPPEQTLPLTSSIHSEKISCVMTDCNKKSETLSFACATTNKQTTPPASVMA
eukprot:2648914-Prymnesium_polylepis.1